jgi:hypothetical protein
MTGSLLKPSSTISAIALLIAFGSPYHRRPNGSASGKSDQRRVDTRFKLPKYCPCTEPSVENCGSPTLRFGELLDFSLSFCPRHSAAWPAAFQVTIKNNAESPLFELLRDVFRKRFQGSIVCHSDDNG